MDGSPTIEIDRERTAGELVGASFELYRRFPWLFLALAAVVVLPYQAIDLIATFDLHGAASAVVGFFLSVAEFALVLPLVYAFHVYAVDDIRHDRRPTFGSVGRRGVAKLRTVSAATVTSWIGITVGFILLVVPGIVLFLRWAVVAQVAAMEDLDWESALAGSRELTRHRYGHVAGLLILVFLIFLIPAIAVTAIFGLRTHFVSYLIRVPIAVLTSSFSALAGALLYFDLRARSEEAAADGTTDDRGPSAPEDREGLPVEPSGHPLDPDSYSDADRPSGWYVVPDKPWRMRHWSGESWSSKTAKAPKDVQQGWWKVSDR